MIKYLITKSLLTVNTILTRRITLELDRIPYQIENISYKKIFNWLFANLSMLFKTEAPLGFPTHVQIEPASICNLRCHMCPVTIGMNRCTGCLDFSVYKTFIDEVGDYLFAIVLWDWGEPFLHPKIFNIISYATRKNIKVVTSTNGHFLTMEDNADRIIQSGLDGIIIAVDGITQNTYEQFRKGGDLEKVLEGIRTLVERKRALNSKTPFINLRSVAMKHNESELPEIRTKAELLGVDAFSIKSFDYFYSYESENQRSDFLPENKRLWRWILDDKGLPLRRRKNLCTALWLSPLIHSNGRVCSCWMDKDEKHPLGDLSNSTFRKIWFDKKYRELRKEFGKDWTKNELCNRCTYAYEGGSCTGETIVEVNFFN
jgi:radical SAM protein with 4Fe4S-binding SPASM domain